MKIKDFQCLLDNPLQRDMPLLKQLAALDCIPNVPVKGQNDLFFFSRRRVPPMELEWNRNNVVLFE